MILVTGAAGFIGSSLCARLAAAGETFVGVDFSHGQPMDRLKVARVNNWTTAGLGGVFVVSDVANTDAFAAMVKRVQPTTIVHLAAQAGVRYSIEDPKRYLRENVEGQLSVVEAMRHHAPDAHLIYASSSSVYGERTAAMGFRETDPLAPASYYAATKVAAEATAQAYSDVFGLRTTGLRFFTVYGPWGRPDMAPMLFARAIRAGQPIDVYGDGSARRDLTFIDDVVDAILALIEQPAGPREHRVFNVGAEAPYTVAYLVGLIERAVGRVAVKNTLPRQPGDVGATFANSAALRIATDWRPKVSLEEGVGRFVAWLNTYEAMEKAA